MRRARKPNKPRPSPSTAGICDRSPLTALRFILDTTLIDILFGGWLLLVVNQFYLLVQSLSHLIDHENVYSFSAHAYSRLRLNWASTKVGYLDYGFFVLALLMWVLIRYFKIKTLHQQPKKFFANPRDHSALTGFKVRVRIGKNKGHIRVSRFETVSTVRTKIINGFGLRDGSFLIFNKKQQLQNSATVKESGIHRRSKLRITLNTNSPQRSEKVSRKIFVKIGNVKFKQSVLDATTATQLLQMLRRTLIGIKTENFEVFFKDRLLSPDATLLKSGVCKGATVKIIKTVLVADKVKPLLPARGCVGSLVSVQYFPDSSPLIVALPAGRSQMLHVRGDPIVASIKDIINKLWPGIDHNAQRLIFDGEVLVSDMPISHYGIRPNDTVQLLLPLYGGCPDLDVTPTSHAKTDSSAHSDTEKEKDPISCTICGKTMVDKGQNVDKHIFFDHIPEDEAPMKVEKRGVRNKRYYCPICQLQGVSASSTSMPGILTHFRQTHFWDHEPFDIDSVYYKSGLIVPETTGLSAFTDLDSLKSLFPNCSLRLTGGVILIQTPGEPIVAMISAATSTSHLTNNSTIQSFFYERQHLFGIQCLLFVPKVERVLCFKATRFCFLHMSGQIRSQCVKFVSKSEIETKVLQTALNNPQRELADPWLIRNTPFSRIPCGVDLSQIPRTAERRFRKRRSIREPDSGDEIVSFFEVMSGFIPAEARPAIFSNAPGIIWNNKFIFVEFHDGPWLPRPPFVQLRTRIQRVADLLPPQQNACIILVSLDTNHLLYTRSLVEGTIPTICNGRPRRKLRGTARFGFVAEEFETVLNHLGPFGVDIEEDFIEYYGEDILMINFTEKYMLKGEEPPPTEAIEYLLRNVRASTVPPDKDEHALLQMFFDPKAPSAIVDTEYFTRKGRWDPVLDKEKWKDRTRQLAWLTLDDHDQYLRKETYANTSRHGYVHGAQSNTRSGFFEKFTKMFNIAFEWSSNGCDEYIYTITNPNDGELGVEFRSALWILFDSFPLNWSRRVSSLYDALCPNGSPIDFHDALPDCRAELFIMFVNLYSRFHWMAGWPVDWAQKRFCTLTGISNEQFEQAIARHKVANNKNTKNAPVRTQVKQNSVTRFVQNPEVYSDELVAPSKSTQQLSHANLAFNLIQSILHESTLDSLYINVNFVAENLGLTVEEV